MAVNDDLIRQLLAGVDDERPTPRHQSRTRPTTKPPLNRDYLDRGRQRFYILLSALALAISWLATIAACYKGEAILRGEGSVVGIVVGVLVALLLTAGQMYSSDDSLLIYLLFLTPDVALTYSQGQPLAERLLEAAMPGQPDLTFAITTVGLLLLSLVISYIPERTLFGPRRR